MSNSDPSELARLSALDFAAVVPLILPSIDWRQSNVDWSVQNELVDLLVSRLTAAPPSLEDPLVSAVHAILAAPTTEAAELKFPLVHRVIGSLPKECIEPYRDALVHLTKDPTETLPWTIGTISARSTEIVEFLNATQAWVPRHKGDDMAYRSLDLLMHTTDEMCPPKLAVISGLLIPARALSGACGGPDPIREEPHQGDDGEWEASLVRFLRDVVPPERREEAREEVERIVQRPTQNKIDSAVDEYANECLQAMDDWLERKKRLRGISPPLVFERNRIYDLLFAELLPLLSRPTELAQLYDAEGWLPGLAELKCVIALNLGQETPRVRDYNTPFSQNGLPEAFAAASNSVYSDM
ncbi:hypothetical protein B0H14DRAFT_3488709 [Mycena olivaceomarginata]|nr:hypothetical protein B0H14DRAFT_3488709 [Mycena olivaceomarginata]